MEILIPFYKKMWGAWYAGYTPIGKSNIVSPAVLAPTLFHALRVWVVEHPIKQWYRHYKWKKANRDEIDRMNALIEQMKKKLEIS